MKSFEAVLRRENAGWLDAGNFLKERICKYTHSDMGRAFIVYVYRNPKPNISTHMRVNV